jgi:hypothetical protein
LAAQASDPHVIASKTMCRPELAMEKSNHVSYPVPPVRKYEFVAPDLAPAQRNPLDIVSFCRGSGPDRTSLGLTTDAATTQSKAARVRFGFSRAYSGIPALTGSVICLLRRQILLRMAQPHRQAPAPEPAQLRNDLLGFSSLP